MKSDSCQRSASVDARPGKHLVRGCGNSSALILGKALWAQLHTRQLPSLYSIHGPSGTAHRACFSTPAKWCGPSRFACQCDGVLPCQLMSLHSQGLAEVIGQLLTPFMQGPCPSPIIVEYLKEALVASWASNATLVDATIVKMCASERCWPGLQFRFQVSRNSMDSPEMFASSIVR